MKKKFLFILTVATLLVLAGCQSAEQNDVPVVTPTTEASEATATPEPTATNTPAPTATNTPTQTNTPTPKPTNTPAPTPTPAPSFEPEGTYWYGEDTYAYFLDDSFYLDEEYWGAYVWNGEIEKFECAGYYLYFDYGWLCVERDYGFVSSFSQIAKEDYENYIAEKEAAKKLDLDGTYWFSEQDGSFLKFEDGNMYVDNENQGAYIAEKDLSDYPEYFGELDSVEWGDLSFSGNIYSDDNETPSRITLFWFYDGYEAGMASYKMISEAEYMTDPSENILDLVDNFDGTYWCGDYNETYVFADGKLYKDGESYSYKLVDSYTVKVITEYDSWYFVINDVNMLEVYYSEYDFNNGYYYSIVQSCNENEYFWEHCYLSISSTYWYNESIQEGVRFESNSYYKDNKADSLKARDYNENIIVIADENYNEIAYFMKAGDTLYYAETVNAFNNLSTCTEYKNCDLKTYYSYYPNNLRDTYWLINEDGYVKEALYICSDIMYTYDEYYYDRSESYTMVDENTILVRTYDMVQLGPDDGYMDILTTYYTIKEDGKLYCRVESLMEGGEIKSKVYEPCTAEEIIDVYIFLED